MNINHGSVSGLMPLPAGLPPLPSLPNLPNLNLPLPDLSGVSLTGIPGLPASTTGTRSTSLASVSTKPFCFSYEVRCYGSSLQNSFSPPKKQRNMRVVIWLGYYWTLSGSHAPFLLLSAIVQTKALKNAPTQRSWFVFGGMEWRMMWFVLDNVKNIKSDIYE